MKSKHRNFKKYKSDRFFVFKGEISAGKTHTAISRAVDLSNEYCLYNSDNILYITNEEKQYIIDNYKNLKENDTNLTFFSAINNSFEVLSVNNLIDSYFSSYSKKSKHICSIIEDKEDKIKVIIEGISKLKLQYPKSKLLNIKNSTFLLEEIEYIKSNGIENLEDYQELIRKGREKKLSKSSSSREVIYNLLIFYNSFLKQNNLIDSIDKEVLARKEGSKESSKKYTHIILDNSEKLTKSQLQFVKALFQNKAYSNFVVVINDKVNTNPLAYFTSNKEIKSFYGENKYKVVRFKEKTLMKQPSLNTNKYLYEENLANDDNDSRGNTFINKSIQEVQSIALKEKEITKKDNLLEGHNLKQEDKFLNYTQNEKDSQMKMVNSYMEYFGYYDIRNKKIYDFAIDSSSCKEIILEPNGDGQTLKEDELRSVAVYSDIAAGEPILISDEIEGAFNIPTYWLKGVKDAFMLKVKGNSMIGANIHDGDYVLIRKQSIANNRDIVAVDLDGNATLKRLSITKEGIFLIPENPKYDPIKVENEDTMIIGTAIGVISRK
jgi:SOS regulatory protein LexA